MTCTALFQDCNEYIIKQNASCLIKGALTCLRHRRRHAEKMQENKTNEVIDR